MKEKTQKPKQTTGGGGGSLFDSVPGMLPNPMVNVSCGPYAEELPVSGMSVGEVRKRFADRLDIDAKSQAIINGNSAKDDVILNTGENLMFIKHAGEKGAKSLGLVTLEGELATVKTPEGSEFSMNIPTLAERMGHSMSTGQVILPSGVKSVLSQGPVTVWAWEKPPHIAKFRWIATDSPIPYGSGAKYRNVMIALPYLIILAVFVRDGNGLPQLVLKDECFFRNSPLKSLSDELSFPALLNCSKFSSQNGNPLSWICTQYLKHTQQMSSNDPGDRFQAGFEAVRYCLLETAFNLSSEHHEGNSWFGESKKTVAQVETVERWEAETKKNPLFVLDVPWLPTGHTLKSAVDRIFLHHGAGAGFVKSAADVARIVCNG